MSQSLASAKRRRAPVQEPPVNTAYPSQQQQQPTQPSSVGLTLPQVIQIVDKRLTILEKFMSDVKPILTDNGEQRIQGEQGQEEEEEGEVALTLPNVVEEFNQRYELLAEEIVNIKNIVLSLQSYTMDVNKMLLEERTLLQPNDISNNGEPTE
jgi:hypothetical protein